jgi:hypothetical protein
MFLAKPSVALGFGAFFLCAATCIHFDSIVPANWFSWPLDDWAAALFLIFGGSVAMRNWPKGRAYQVAGWAFLVSLLFGSFLEGLHDWTSGAPDAGGTTGFIVIPQGPFVILVGIVFAIALGGLASSLRAAERAAV